MLEITTNKICVDFYDYSQVKRKGFNFTLLIMSRLILVLLYSKANRCQQIIIWLPVPELLCLDVFHLFEQRGHYDFSMTDEQCVLVHDHTKEGGTHEKK